MRNHLETRHNVATGVPVKPKDKQDTEAYFSYGGLIIVLPLTRWSDASPVLPCPSHSSSGLSGSHDPMWEEMGASTKRLPAIHFAQATFTIIQRDSCLIALTLLQACLSQHSPSSMNTKKHLSLIRAGIKCWRESPNGWVIIPICFVLFKLDLVLFIF